MPDPPVRRLRIIAVASPYAWDVVESALRAGMEVDCVDNHGTADETLPALRGLETVDDQDVPWTLGLSSAVHRGRAARALADAGFRDPVALIDPSSVVASTADVGHGAYLNAGTVVGSHARIGCHANVNRSASVGHDCDLGFASSLGPGAILTGHVRIGPSAFVGAGAVVLPGITVGQGAVVGAGSVVTRDVPGGAVHAGSPAKALRSQKEEIVTSCPHCSNG
jgi:sugar O-acyltransferase (sialic acid O-acetyltransferase NeuD family)